MVDVPARQAQPPAYPSPATLNSPCGPARAEVEYRCAEAESLAQAAQIQVRRLRDAKRMLARLQAQRDADANDPTDQLELADQHAAELTRQVVELTAALPGIELAADAARIAAEAAQVTCVDARRALAACEEDAPRQVRFKPNRRVMPAAQSAAAPPAPPAPAPVAPAAPVGPAAPVAPAAPPATAAPPASLVSATGPEPISLLLGGDRQALLGLTLRLAEETGVEAGRLQLLLIELREAIAARALEDNALAFPAGHPFWSQFAEEDCRQLAISLGRLGYAFDGRDGWRERRAPGARELALALEHAGHDARALRRPAGQTAIDELWKGTTVLVQPWLAAAAPDLSLGQLIDVLGPCGARLGELWDVWGRLRPLLVGASPTA